MVARIKNSEFVASTARYAKKAALAADKNKDGKLSKTEAKRLPKDLQDDYARQAKTKSRITPEGFARDQAAYVASSAKRADRNKDGLLSATEAAALPSTLKNNYENFVKAGAQPTVTPGAFIGTGRGTRLTIDGLSFTQLPVSADASQLIAKLGADSDTGSTFATAFKGTPADVKAALDDFGGRSEFFNQLLFRATGTSYDLDYPQYYAASALSASKMTAANALSDAQGDFSGSSTPTAGEVPADVKALVDAMKEPGVQFVKLSWSNQDDASFSATVALNAKTGLITAFGRFSEP